MESASRVHRLVAGQAPSQAMDGIRGLLNLANVRTLKLLRSSTSQERQSESCAGSSNFRFTARTAPSEFVNRWPDQGLFCRSQLSFPLRKQTCAFFTPMIFFQSRIGVNLAAEQPRLDSPGLQLGVCCGATTCGHRSIRSVDSVSSAQVLIGWFRLRARHHR